MVTKEALYEKLFIKDYDHKIYKINKYIVTIMVRNNNGTPLSQHKKALDENIYYAHKMFKE